MTREPDLTLRYVTDFKCIGGDCEDTCCRDWQVFVDKASYRTLETLMCGSPEGQNRFETCIKPNPDAEERPAEFAVIAMDGTGFCPFLDVGTGWCTIHRDLGESALGQVCTTYPRQLSRIDGRTELSLALSCPEAARRCLATADAIEPVPLPPDRVAGGKYFLTHVIPEDHPNPYLRHTGLVRQVMWQLLGLSEFPLASRLFIVAGFASRIAPFFNADTADLDETRLADEIDRLARPGLPQESHRQYEDLTAGIDLSMTIILTILAGRGRESTSLQTTLLDIWRTYGIEVRDGEARFETRDGGTTFDFSGLIAQFIERRDRLVLLFRERHELHLTNYCFNYLFKEPCGTFHDPLAYAQSLFVRRAILRFLVFSSPRWNDLLATPARTLTPELARAFEEVSVDIMYRFSRTIEHDRDLPARIHDTLAEQDMQSLAHLVLLLKI